MMKLLFPLALLGAGTVFAETRAARLLTDTPTVVMGATPRLLDAALSATDVKDAAVPAVAGLGPLASVRTGFGEHFGKTAAIGMASSVTGVLIGAGLGTLSNNLIAAAVPVLLVNLFFPPIVTVLMAMLIGNWDSPGRFGFWGPVAGAFAANAAAYVIASLLLVVPWTNPMALLLYSLVDGLLMSGATVGIMHLTEKKAPATITSFVPGVSDTAFISLTRVNL